VCMCVCVFIVCYCVCKIATTADSFIQLNSMMYTRLIKEYGWFDNRSRADMKTARWCIIKPSSTMRLNRRMIHCAIIN